MKFAIIGGNTENIGRPYREREVETPYGPITLAEVSLAGGKECLIITRHSMLQERDARDVNYRGNIFGLSLCGVTHVIGVSCVGACDYAHKLGSFCLLTDFLDFTHCRENSFAYEHRLVPHAGMEEVFCAALNDVLEREILENNLPYAGRVIYAGTDGPRFETASEVRMFRMLGAQVIGMDILPEAPLAAERALKYASIGIISNYATGMAFTVTDKGIEKVNDEKKGAALDLILNMIERMKV
ncbi:MAG: MTAP family purine nucleoside phosphorylase [Clostridiales bacterium]|nr:MTAP family purine nucleoside phosphorylase [Clostridiales bacterium]